MDTADTFQTLNIIFSVLSFVLGTMIGSFLNVCVHRMPKGLSVIHPRSRCPQCESSIQWYDNFPILSWLILGAKCRNCKTPISWQYPLVEAITGFLFFLVFWRFGITVASGVYMLLAASMVLVTFVDLTDWTIPNEVTLPGIFVGIGCALVITFYPESMLHIEGPFTMPVANSLLGIVVGGGSLFLLDKASLLILGKRGMGGGDVKLLAMLGAFFGLYGVVLIIAISSVLGSIVGILMMQMQKRAVAEGGEEVAAGHYLPFGPYLALAGVIYMLYGPNFIAWYTSQFAAPGNYPQLPL